MGWSGSRAWCIRMVGWWLSIREGCCEISQNLASGNLSATSRMGGNWTSILFQALWGTFASPGTDKEKSYATSLSLTEWWCPMVSLEDKRQAKFYLVLIWTLQNSGQSTWSLLTNQQEDRFWRWGMDINDFPLACSPLWLLFPLTFSRHSEAKAIQTIPPNRKWKPVTK